MVISFCLAAMRASSKLERLAHTMSITMPTATEGRRDLDSQWAVETHGLTKRFGENVAVNGVELLVPRGCAFGYLGPNGAGKTTLIRVLLGLTSADAGTMRLLGHSVPRHRAAGPPGSAVRTDRGLSPPHNSR